MNVSKLFYTFIHKALKTDSSKIFMRLYMPNDWTELMNWFHSILLCDSAACQFRGRKNYFVIYKAHSLIVSSQKRHNSQCQARKKMSTCSWYIENYVEQLFFTRNIAFSSNEFLWVFLLFLTHSFLLYTE